MQEAMELDQETFRGTKRKAEDSQPNPQTPKRIKVEKQRGRQWNGADGLV